MASTAMLLTPAAAKAAFWDTFRRAAQSQVEECNVLAGERLWVVACCPESDRKFVVRSATSHSDSVGCFFDAERGVLTCRPGSGIQAGGCRFRLDETTGKLRRGGTIYTLDEALAEILGRLSWADE